MFRETKNFRDYSLSTIEDIFANHSNKVQRKIANTMDSMVFFNLGQGRFQAEPLPMEVQWAPVFGVSVCDFDGDGHQDLFLCQNQTHIRKGLPSQSQGRGLMLLGDGDRGWQVLSDEVSGARLTGDLRSVVTLDFNKDAKQDLLVSQNEGAITLLMNQSSSSHGLRVVIRGPGHNPLGIGCQLRLDRERPEH